MSLPIQCLLDLVSILSFTHRTKALHFLFGAARAGRTVRHRPRGEFLKLRHLETLLSSRSFLATAITACHQEASQEPEGSKGVITTTRVPVLMYHEIGEPLDAWERRYFVTPERFRANMIALRKADYWPCPL